MTQHLSSSEPLRAIDDIAAILATGFLRLVKQRSALPEKTPKSANSGLEVAPGTVLSVGAVNNPESPES